MGGNLDFIYCDPLVKRHKKRKRVGRGRSSGLGKTCGKGHKGQLSRSGVSISWMEGGQQPIYRALPKRGFKSLNDKKFYSIVNLGDIAAFINDRIDCHEVGIVQMKEFGLVRSNAKVVKILAGYRDESTKLLKRAISFNVNAVSKSAAELIMASNGKINIV